MAAGFRSFFRGLMRGIKGVSSAIDSPFGRLVMGGAVVATGGAAAPAVVLLGRIAHAAAKGVAVAEQAIAEPGTGQVRALHAATVVASDPDLPAIIADLSKAAGKDLDPDKLAAVMERANDFAHAIGELMDSLPKRGISNGKE